MQCKELESVLEGQGLGPLPDEAQQHLAGCQACQGILADFSAIAAIAKTIPADVNPPDRIWISVRAQLKAEGLIREPVEIPEKSPQRQNRWQNLAALLGPRNLATVGVGLLLLIGAALETRKIHGPASTSDSNVATGSNIATPASLVPQVALPAPSEAGVTLQQAEQDLPNIQLAGNSTVDASLRQNLRTVNEFIAECEHHLKLNPQDEMAREYLYSAYQQKADLLAAMMDSGRSEH
jgi:hypothetical protein